MRPATIAQAIPRLLAIATMFGVGGGCIALYGFDDFEKKPPISCQSAEDCPGTDSCGKRACVEGTCTIVNPVAAGLFAPKQPKGDCKSITCDGKGNEIFAVDTSDIPNDGNPCTDDVCEDSVPLSPFSAAGKVCGTVDTVTCDGMGNCLNCASGAECGSDDICVTWACENAVCKKIYAPVGTEAANPIPGDCKKNYCNAIGETPEEVATDDPPSDGNPCTSDSCTLEGEALHEASSPGAKCGDCLACTAEGACSPCDIATTDCYANTCVPKPTPCTQSSDCVSTYCVDGYCCDSECGGLCVACSNAKTGIPSGICAPIAANTDPDNECTGPDADTCVNGACRCSNGIQDSGETGTDCGGGCDVCTGTWNCGGTGACDGFFSAKTCCYNCGWCPDNKNVCTTIENQTCTIGTPAQVIALGTYSDSNCSSNTACNGFVTCTCQ